MKVYWSILDLCVWPILVVVNFIQTESSGLQGAVRALGALLRDPQGWWWWGHNSSVSTNMKSHALLYPEFCLYLFSCFNWHHSSLSWCLLSSFRATKLGTLLGCPTLNSTELETCLQNTSASLLVHTQFALERTGFIKSPFIPVIDGVFLPDTVQVCITFLIYWNSITVVLIVEHGVHGRRPSSNCIFIFLLYCWAMCSWKNI